MKRTPRFGRNQLATPRHSCRFCGKQGSLSECSGCDEPICDDCADSHFEDHEV